MRSVSGCSNLIERVLGSGRRELCGGVHDRYSARAPYSRQTRKQYSGLSSALRGEIEVAPMHELDLPARRFGRAAVVDDVVRGFQARRAIDLRSQHRQRFRFRNRIAPHQALELQRFRAIDDENPIDELAEARLDEQRHGDERVGGGQLRELRARAARESADAGSLRASAASHRRRRRASAARGGSSRRTATALRGRIPR